MAGVEPDAFGLTAIGALLDEVDDPVDWLVDQLIPAGAVAVMAAKPKVGKSTAARHLALAVARGSTWLGRARSAGPVWYLAFEGRRRDIKAHFRQMGATA
ncbi:MAG: AAA family ATPase, partial [Pseudolysinimonas sp.]